MMAYYERQQEKIKNEILRYLRDGELFLNQIVKLTQKSESYLRRVLKQMAESGLIAIKNVWNGKAKQYQYTLQLEEDKPKYNKWLTMKWESKQNG